MTVQPTRDQLRAGLREMIACFDKHGVPAGISPRDMESLLDQLDTAEQRIRDLTQEVRDERGAARDQMEQVRIRDARIKAVRDLCDAEEDPDQWPPRPVMHGGEPFPATLYVEDIRRALEVDA